MLRPYYGRFQRDAEYQHLPCLGCYKLHPRSIERRIKAVVAMRAHAEVGDVEEGVGSRGGGGVSPLAGASRIRGGGELGALCGLRGGGRGADRIDGWKRLTGGDGRRGRRARGVGGRG